MKLSKTVDEVVLAIGVILIALRLFFPVKEYQIFMEGNRISERAFIVTDKDIRNFEKTVSVSKTVFQSCGIAVLFGGIILLLKFIRKKESENITVIPNDDNFTKNKTIAKDSVENPGLSNEHMNPQT